MIFGPPITDGPRLGSRTVIFTCLALLCHIAYGQQEAGPASAQQQITNPETSSGLPLRSSIQQLKIGDAIPEVLWQLPLEVANHPNGKKKITLSDYKESKLLLLDFWATWCKPCIFSLQKLDSLQPAYKGDIAILPVTYETSDKAGKFFQGKGWSLPTVANDSLLKAYFPYRSIPQQVWIKEGKVYAITGPSYATATNFDRYLKGEKFYIKMNNDSLYFDAQKPLLIDGNGGGAEQLLYQSTFSKRVDAFIGGISYASDGKQFMATNVTYPSIIEHAFSNLGWMDKKRVIYEINDKIIRDITSFDASKLKETGIGEMQIQWLDENTYCYNLILPDSTTQSDFRKIIQEDINRFFSRTKGLIAQLEKRKRPVLVLKKRGNLDALKTKGGKRMVGDKHAASYTCINMTFGYIENFLYNVDKVRVIINEVDFEGNMDITLPKAIDGNFPLARKELAKYGLDLVEEDRELEVLVVRHVNP